MPVTEIPLKDIKVRDGFNPRSQIERTELESLTKSIAARGLLQPLVVTPIDGEHYLIDGHRRHAALTAAGFDAAPCVIRNGPVSESEAEQLIDAVTTAVQRSDLPPVDEARAYQRMRDQRYSVKQIATELGVSQKRVTERLALLELPGVVQDMLNGGLLTQGHVPLLLQAAKVSPKLAEGIGYKLGDESIPAGQFQEDPLGCVGQVSDPEMGVWIFNGYMRGQLPISDKSAEAIAEIEQLTGYSYRVAFDSDDIDAGVKFGAIWSPDAGNDWDEWFAVADPAWFTDRIDQLVAKDLRDARKQARERGKATTQTVVNADGEAEEVPLTEDELKEQRRQQTVAERTARNKVHAANLKLGSDLLTKAAKLTVDRRAALNIASLVLRGTGNELAARGLALMLGQYAVEKVAKDGQITSRHYDAELATYDVAGFIAEGKTPEEVFGRLAVVIGAAHLASTEAVAASNRPAYTWANTSDKAFADVIRELVAPALPPASRKGLGKGKAALEQVADINAARRVTLLEHREKDAQAEADAKAKAKAEKAAAKAKETEGDGAGEADGG